MNAEDYRLTPPPTPGRSKLRQRMEAIEHSWWSEHGNWIASWLDRFAETPGPASESNDGSVRIMAASDRSFARWQIRTMIEDRARLVALHDGSWTEITLTEGDLDKVCGRVRTQQVPGKLAALPPLRAHYVRRAIADDERGPE